MESAPASIPAITQAALEHEVLCRHHFATRAEARAMLGAWCHDFYNTDRRHSSAAMLAPIDYENTDAQPPTGRRRPDEHTHHLVE